MNHTPGPWEIHNREEVYWDPTEPVRLKGIGPLNIGDIETDWLMLTDADANLIAAAPDLLAALDGLLGYVDGVFFMNGWETDFQPAVINARLALAKAKGEE